MTEDFLNDLFDIDLAAYLYPELPALAGGSPIGLPDIPGLLGAIFGGAADLGEKIRDALAAVATAIWESIGGILAYVWAGLSLPLLFLQTLINFGFAAVQSAISYARNVLWDHISGWSSFLGTHISGWFNWTLDRLNDARNALWNHISGWSSFLGDHISGWFNWTLDRLNDARNALWDHVSGWSSFLGDHISGWFNWTLDRLNDARNALWDHISGWSSFLGDHISGWFNWTLDRLGDAVEFLRKHVLDTVMAGAQVLGNWVKDAIEWLVGRALEPIVDFIQSKMDIPRRLVAGGFPSLASFVDAVMDPPREIAVGPIYVFAWAFVGVLSLIFGLLPAFAPINRLWAREMDYNVRSNLPTVGALTEMLQRDFIADGQFRFALGLQGLPDEFINNFVRLAESLPSPTDLVRFGVREVFTPEIAQRFGQFEDFPEQFATEMKLHGFPRERALQYWAAHWDLPSATQGFEMLHRGVISFDDLRILLRALDVMPFWRDRLVQISYNPLTRVDVRRMYQSGVIDRDKVKRTYLALGYIDEDAEALTEFTVKKYPRAGAETDIDFRNLTLGVIKNAFARRLIDREDAILRIQDLDYDPDDAELIVAAWEFDWTLDPGSRGDLNIKELGASTIERAYERRLIDYNNAVTELGVLGFTPEDAKLKLDLVDLKLNEQLADLEIDIVLNEYQAGTLSESQLAARLGDFNIPAARIDFLLQKELLRRQAKTARLTLAQLIRGWRSDLISEAELRTRLSARGYAEVDIDIILVDQPVRLGVGGIQRAFREGRIAEADFRARLGDLGFSSEDIALLLSVAVRPLTLGQLQTAFREDRLTEAEFRTRVQALGFAPVDVDLLVPFTERELIVSQLQKAFKKEIITEAEFRSRMTSLGFSAASVDILVALAAAA